MSIILHILKNPDLKIIEIFSMTGFNLIDDYLIGINLVKLIV